MAVFIIRSVSTSIDYQAERISPLRSAIWKHSSGPGFTAPRKHREYLICVENISKWLAAVSVRQPMKDRKTQLRTYLVTQLLTLLPDLGKKTCGSAFSHRS